MSTRKPLTRRRSRKRGTLLIDTVFLNLLDHPCPVQQKQFLKVG
jgi:hypothetical protein